LGVKKTSRGGWGREPGTERCPLRDVGAGSRPPPPDQGPQSRAWKWPPWKRKGEGFDPRLVNVGPDGGDVQSRRHYRVAVHLVWATKHRTPWLSEIVRPRLLALLAQILLRKRCRPVAIGGWVDHVHVYAMLSPQIAVVTLVNALKANSARWLRTNVAELAAFQWQRGYAAFGVDPRRDGTIRSYIQSQNEIHQARSSRGKSPHRS
jgi:putative transposase